MLSIRSLTGPIRKCGSLKNSKFSPKNPCISVDECRRLYLTPCANYPGSLRTQNKGNTILIISGIPVPFAAYFLIKRFLAFWVNGPCIRQLRDLEVRASKVHWREGNASWRSRVEGFGMQVVIYIEYYSTQYTRKYIFLFGIV